MNTGAFGENFPYSNFHDLNMDWIIKIAKDFLDQYTHIQEIIANGEESLENLTTSGLAQLQEKYENLDALLQAWYNEHSQDIADQLADALADLNEWYSTHENYLDNTLAENIAEFNSSAEAKSQALLDSWPDDYSDLVTKYNAIQSAITDGSIFHPQAIITESSFDLNNCVSNRVYLMASACANRPSDFDAGFVLTYAVNQTSTYKLQICTSLYSNQEVWIRSCDNGTWGSWVVIQNGKEVRALANITSSEFDLNDCEVNRIYLVSANVIHTPVEWAAGIVITYAVSTASAYRVQIFYNLNGKTYTRARESASSWTNWKCLDDQITNLQTEVAKTAIIYGGVLADTVIYSDFNTLPVGKLFLLASSGFSHVPLNMDVGYVVTLSHNSTSGYKTQIFIDFYGNIYSRTCDNGTWSTWSQSNDSEKPTNLYYGIPKMGIIGDSLASGATYDGTTTRDHYEYSWAKVMERESGQTYKWFSYGGAGTEDWLTNTEHGLPNALLPENKCNCYMVGLMVNDHYSQPASYIGTIDDIKADPDQNANSFYGNYGKIIQKLTASNPDAKFFLFTNPRDNSGTYADYNNAVRSIANKFSNCYLVDLFKKYHYIFTDPNGIIVKSKSGDQHYNAIAYAYMGKLIGTAVSEVIEENATDFLYVQFE